MCFQISGLIVTLLCTVLAIIRIARPSPGVSAKEFYWWASFVLGASLLIVISVYRLRKWALFAFFLVFVGLIGISMSYRTICDDTSFITYGLPMLSFLYILPAGILCCLIVVCVSLIRGNKRGRESLLNWYMGVGRIQFPGKHINNVTFHVEWAIPQIWLRQELCRIDLTRRFLWNEHTFIPGWILL